MVFFINFLFYFSFADATQESAGKVPRQYGQTRIIEKSKGTRVFGTPEFIHDPNVPSVKTMLDESSFGE